MEHAILHETIDGQRVNFYPETGFDDVVQTDGDDDVTLRMVLEGMDAAIALLQNGLAAKANAADVYTKDNLYTKIETNNLLSGKSNKATTLAGYGITNAYTKTEVDNSLDTKANKTDTYTKTEVDDNLANYLPLSGGEMNGGIKIADTLFNNVPTIYKNTNTSYTEVRGGVSANTGAYIRLNGKDETTQGGQARIVACDGTNTKILKCYPSGSLTWVDKEVERVNSSRTNYIRYESGVQICWGFQALTTQAVTVTYPQAFKQIPCITTSINTGASTPFVISVTSTTFSCQRTNYDSNNRDVRWIAIGYWK